MYGYELYDEMKKIDDKLMLYDCVLSRL
jgi:hypothetical protein